MERAERAARAGVRRRSVRRSVHARSGEPPGDSAAARGSGRPRREPYSSRDRTSPGGRRGGEHAIRVPQPTVSRPAVVPRGLRHVFRALARTALLDAQSASASSDDRIAGLRRGLRIRVAPDVQRYGGAGRAFRRVREACGSGGRRNRDDAARRSRRGTGASQPRVPRLEREPQVAPRLRRTEPHRPRPARVDGRRGRRLALRHVHARPARSRPPLRRVRADHRKRVPQTVRPGRCAARALWGRPRLAPKPGRSPAPPHRAVARRDARRAHSRSAHADGGRTPRCSSWRRSQAAARRRAEDAGSRTPISRRRAAGAKAHANRHGHGRRCRSRGCGRRRTGGLCRQAGAPRHRGERAGERPGPCGAVARAGVGGDDAPGPRSRARRAPRTRSGEGVTDRAGRIGAAASALPLARPRCCTLARARGRAPIVAGARAERAHRRRDERGVQPGWQPAAERELRQDGTFVGRRERNGAARSARSSCLDQRGRFQPRRARDRDRRRQPLYHENGQNRSERHRRASVGRRHRTGDHAPLGLAQSAGERGVQCGSKRGRGRRHRRAALDLDCRYPSDADRRSTHPGPSVHRVQPRRKSTGGWQPGRQGDRAECQERGNAGGAPSQRRCPRHRVRRHGANRRPARECRSEGHRQGLGCAHVEAPPRGQQLQRGAQRHGALARQPLPRDRRRGPPDLGHRDGRASAGAVEIRRPLRRVDERRRPDDRNRRPRRVRRPARLRRVRAARKAHEARDRAIASRVHRTGTQGFRRKWKPGRTALRLPTSRVRRGRRETLSGQGLRVQREETTPRLLGRRLVIDLRIRRAPAVRGAAVDLDFGR